MPKSTGVIMVVISAIWLQSAAPATAQNMLPFDTVPYTSSAVSPYLNLGINQYGVSNYQSLVKPMIEDREALTSQSVNIQRLQQQLRESKLNTNQNESRGKSSKTSAASVRFMHYSHFFNSLP